VIGIVHGHGGALSVNSELGKGTSISIYFAVLPDSESIVVPDVTEVSK
jgi:signal transduction histidine kinase